MAAEPSTLTALARELGRALAPLEQRLKAGEVRQLFTELGLTIPDSTPLPAAFVTALGTTVNSAALLPPRIGQVVAAIDDDDQVRLLSASVALLKDVTDLVTALKALGGALGANAGSFPGVSPAAVTALAGELAKRIGEYCFLNYLEGYFPTANVLTRVLGIADYQFLPGVPADPTRPALHHKSLHLERLKALLQAPIAHFEGIYGWNSSSFDAQRLLEVVNSVLLTYAVPSLLEPVSSSSPLKQLTVTPFRLVPEPTATPPGVSLRFDENLGTNLGFRIPLDAPGLTLELAVKGALNTGVAILFQPPATASFVPAGASGVTLAIENRPATPMVLLALDAKSRVQIGAVRAFFKLDFAGGAKTAVVVGAALEGGKVIIDTSGSDGFLQKLLSGVRVENTFDLGLSFSSTSGIHIDGAGALEIQLASHIDLGPIELSALTLSVGVKDAQFPVGITTNIVANLGPITASVEGIGFEAVFSLTPNNDGNLGPLNLKPGFRPPKGAGLAIDAGIVKGGGYLFFDASKGEYAGVAELSIAEIVTVKAIALITTKLPDGSEGFSLLVIISAEFTPIQLGFGFTLNGVGGLLGLNRSVLLDVLRDGVRTGSVNSILFPKDIVQNAPRIISDLRAVFPPEQGTFLIGPMAKLGWGTPTLITLSLGIILEIPPGNVAILGVLSLALPDENAALIKIQVAFLGVLDFEEQLLSFDASLFDSRILFMTLEGDMAVRLKWGNNAGFLLSVGGFHPAFTPPPGLQLPAQLRRLSVSIIDTDFAKIKIDNYFAVSSNTVQFGAHAYLFFGVDGANISGDVGYDVLFQFSPFYFNALISGSLAIEVFGADLLSIHLRFSLEGPTPWRAKGTGSISILFFDIDVDFDITWGEHKNTSLPPVRVLPIFAAELNKDQNWRALPPPQSNLLVSLRALDPALLVLHPFGALSVTQRAAPLGLKLDKLGSQKPEDVDQVDITNVESDGTKLQTSDVPEQFAIAQFKSLSDSEKLSRPSYQALKGGVSIGAADAIRSSKLTRRKIAHEVVILDKVPRRPLPPGRLQFEANGLFEPFLSGNAVARSPQSFKTKSELQPFAEKIAVGVGGYTVANTADNTALHPAATFSSEAMARDYLHERLATSPELAGTLHVLPNHEVHSP